MCSGGGAPPSAHGVEQPAMIPTAVVGAVREQPVSYMLAQSVAPQPRTTRRGWKRAHLDAPLHTDPTTPGGTCAARPYGRTTDASPTRHDMHQPAMTPTAVVGAVREPPVSYMPAQSVAPQPRATRRGWKRAHHDAPLHTDPSTPGGTCAARPYITHPPRAARAQHGPTSGPPHHHQPRTTWMHRP